MVRLTFFRSVALQIVLVGLVSFTQPGIWNALQVYTISDQPPLCVIAD